MIFAAEYSTRRRKRTFNTMRHSGTTVSDKNGYRRSENLFSAKRKRLDDPLPEEGMQLDDNDHLGEEDRQVPDADHNGSGDEEDELTEYHSDPNKLGSQAMEVSIQQIRQKMDLFTQQVSGLLDAGKNFFIDAATAFEERVVQLHQKQIEKWEQDMEMLRTMDAINEDMSFRLADARATINLVRPGPQIQAPS